MVLGVIFRFLLFGISPRTEATSNTCHPSTVHWYSSTGPTHGETMHASTIFYPVPFFVVRDQADRNGDLGHALPHSSLNIPGESAQKHFLLR
jgi:hypothetical protein